MSPGLIAGAVIAGLVLWQIVVAWIDYREEKQDADK
jgi:hypothetical protein